MKILFLIGLAGLGNSLSASCTQGEFAIDGYTTGQNIDINYDATGISMAGGVTQLKVAFYVPKIYSEQYEAAAFAITFNREHDTTDSTSYTNDISALASTATQTGGMPGWQNKVVTTVNQVAGTVDSACFSNRYANYTACPYDGGATAGVWSSFVTNTDNDCIDDTEATVGWTDVMSNGWFGSTNVINDGTYTSVFLTATVETWSHFVQTTAADYAGQMTGNENLNTGGNPTDRTGTYFGDAGGNIGGSVVDYGPLLMDDERYTLYQIPFILRFPKTVLVQTSFTVGSKVTVLSGVVAQDVITVNFNPASDTSAATFAALDVTVTTQIQYPYAIRGPSDQVTLSDGSLGSPMLAYIGSAVDASDAHADSITFLSWDDPTSCGGVHNFQGICSQDFKMRIIPATATPCSVAGDYTLEFLAQCQTDQNGAHAGGALNWCTVDKEATDASLTTRRTSNAYFTLTFTVAHQSFCPEVMDTVKVVGDFNAYHDEAFSQMISADVYSNDVLYYEAVYRTASDSTSQGLTDNTNLPNTAVHDEIIDYVRATKIFVDVTIGKSDDGTALSGWDSANWANNLAWSLGGSRVAGTDFSDSSLTVTQSSGDAAVYNIVLCEAGPITASVIQFSASKPKDCFNDPATGMGIQPNIAAAYFDFNKVNYNPSISSSGSLSGSANTIDENEVAFKLRLDERIIPVGPKTDNSHVKFTIEAEIYYIGNRHPTRRLLQAPATVTQPTLNRQLNIQTLAHPVKFKAKLVNTCFVSDKQSHGTLNLVLDYGTNPMPTLGDANTFALKFGMQLEAHLQVQKAVKVTKIEKCDNGCQVLLDSKKTSNRRLQSTGASELHVTLDISSTQHAAAGKILNTLQTEIQSTAMTSVDAFMEATVVQMTAPGCNSNLGHNNKLASSALRAAPMFLLSVFAFLL